MIESIRKGTIEELIKETDIPLIAFFVDTKRNKLSSIKFPELLLNNNKENIKSLIEVLRAQASDFENEYLKDNN